MDIDIKHKEQEFFAVIKDIDIKNLSNEDFLKGSVSILIIFSINIRIYLRRFIS